MVAVVGSAAAIFAAALLWQADAYTGRLGPYTYGESRWRVEASYSSLFGTIKVLRSDPEPGSGRFLRMYFQDGLTQNTVDSANRSASFYTYALEALARAYKPGMQRALVLGLGAGMVPMRLADLGAVVEVVDIDAASRRVAQRFFGFDPQKVPMHEEDARTYLRGCTGRYDAIVVDLFHGDGTPDYLVTRDFFRDLRRCLTADGVAVFNTFADLQRPRAYAHFLATLRAELPHLALYRPQTPGATFVNSFVVASARALPAPQSVTFDYLDQRHQEALWRMLSQPVPLDAALFQGGRVVSDAINPAAHDQAQMQLGYRKTVVDDLPAPMLIN
jgi:spermidine synthase